MNVAHAFNDQVECDIVEYKTHLIFHMIDRATRWSWGIQESDHRADTLIHARSKWVELHGPMRELICDGGTAIAESMKSAQYLSHNTIRLETRAPGQHA